MAPSKSKQPRCSRCEKAISVNFPSISCCACLSWYHKGCSELTNTEFNKQVSLWNKSKETTWTCSTCLDVSNPQSDNSMFTGTTNRRSIGPGAVPPQDIPQEVSSPSVHSQVTLRDIMAKLLQIESQYTDLLSKYENQIKINAELRSEIADIKRNLSVDIDSGGAAASADHQGSSRDVFSEFHDRERRKNNFIIFGQPDSNAEPNAENDKITALDIINNLMPNNQIDPASIKVFRLGKFFTGKSRPMKVVCGSSEVASKVLLNAKCLKTKPGLSNLSLSSDKTPRQLQEYRETKQRLMDRLAAGETNLKIKYINGSPRIVTTDANHLNSGVHQVIRPV